MEDLKKSKSWTKRYITSNRREPPRSFDAFSLWLEHPDWSLLTLSEKTGIPYNTILQYSSKYKYSDRKAAKIAVESEEVHKLQLESKITNARQTSLRQMVDENVLNAFANLNNKLISKLKQLPINEESLNELQKIDQHFISYFKMSNQQLSNILSNEELIKNIPGKTENENEFNRIAEVLKNSRITEGEEINE